MKWKRPRQHWIYGLSALLLTGCSGLQPLPDWVRKPSPEAVQRVSSGEAILGRPFRASELPEADLFGLSPFMKATAEQLRERHRHPYHLARALHEQLMGSPLFGSFGIRYEAEVTLPSIEAFARREVNCLSYTLMFVAMARHMGLNASVNEVELPPMWDLRGPNSLVLLRHVNAKVRLRRGDWLVVDLAMEQYSPAYDQTVISEELAEVMYYNNRAMELLGQGETERGFLHLRKALDINTNRSYLWNNLGNIYNRKRLYREAETAYLKGLSIDPSDLTIMSNLSTLYANIGEADKSAYFEQRARAYRNRNPYYIYLQARSALSAGDTQKAENLVQKAIGKRKEEPRFYKLAAEIYEHRGEPDKAESMRRKANELHDTLYLE